MIKIFERIFKKEPAFRYTIAEYTPVKFDRMRSGVNVTEYDQFESEELDEIEIDNIYKGM